LAIVGSRLRSVNQTVGTVPDSGRSSLWLKPINPNAPASQEEECHS
jgi:hypothetical protein